MRLLHTAVIQHSSVLVSFFFPFYFLYVYILVFVFGFFFFYEGGYSHDQRFSRLSTCLLLDLKHNWTRSAA